MNDGLMEQLLHEGESSSLDYKRDQYPFVGANDEDKSELLKDILAFANGWRHSDAYILVGVNEVAGGRSTPVGVSNHISESDIQQFVNTKTNRPITFSYRAYPFESKQIGVITIPQQDRPIYLTKNYGRLHKHVVYYRQGTTTAIATPDDIARMGTPIEIKKLLEGQREEGKKEQVRVDLGLIAHERFYADIYNSGDVPVYIKEVALGREMGPNQSMRTPLLVATPMPVTDGKGSVAYVMLGQKNYDLPARKEVRFVLPDVRSLVIQEMAKCPAETLWLAVSTYGGELHRVKGAEVLPVLIEVVKMSKPRTINVIFYTDVNSGVKRQVGLTKAHLAKAGFSGPMQVQLEPVWGIAISDAERDQLCQEIANNRAIGRLGEYGWRIE